MRDMPRPRRWLPFAAEYSGVRALVQRVSEASVTVEGEEVARIGLGLLVLLGVRRGDGEAAADRIASKLLALRVFEDAEGKMNLSVGDLEGELLVVSQFTLYGDARKGNRPSFVEAAPPEEAEPLYERVRAATGAEGGVFGARMAVALVNDGPVTRAARGLRRISLRPWPSLQTCSYGTSSTSAGSGSSPPARARSRS